MRKLILFYQPECHLCDEAEAVLHAAGRGGSYLKVDIEPKVGSYAIEDWIKDIKLRVRATQVQAEQDKLQALESKLKKLTSPEQQRAMALEEIEAELG